MNEINPNPLVGCSGLSPWDSVVTHNLLRELNPMYVRLSFDYNIWVANGLRPDFNGVNPQEYYDKMYELNSMYKIIMTLDNVPGSKLSAFLPMILDRYKVWGVSPINELTDAKISTEKIKAFNGIIPNVRLVGPDCLHSYNPTYMDALVSLGALSCIDTLAVHDYLACPGNGKYFAPEERWDKLPYAHPNIWDTTRVFPSLLGRINWLKSYIPKSRQLFSDDHKIIITEYGLYVNNVNDATTVAKICKETNVPIILSTPNGPVTNKGAHPYSNAIYLSDNTAGTWSEAMKAYLKEINLPKAPLPPGFIVEKETSTRKRNFIQQLLYRLFGWFK